jgi:hypothetical protein
VVTEPAPTWVQRGHERVGLLHMLQDAFPPRTCSGRRPGGENGRRNRRLSRTGTDGPRWRRVPAWRALLSRACIPLCPPGSPVVSRGGRSGCGSPARS